MRKATNSYIFALAALTLLTFCSSAYAESEYYQPAVQAGNFLYVSGQNAQKSNESLKGGIIEQTTQSLGFLSKTLKNHGYKFSDVVEVSVALAKEKDFKQFNKVYHKYFPNKPARSTALGVLHQNKGALVEISLVAYKNKG